MSHDNPALWHASRPDRASLLACTICYAPHDVTCREHDAKSTAPVHVGRRWEIAGCNPGGWTSGSNGHMIAGECSPTIEDRSVRLPGCGPYRWHGPVSHGEYRGACLGCGWAGPTRDSEQLAVEDAHDHSHPQWRDAPLVNACCHDASTAQRDRWRAEVNNAYRLLGLPSWMMLPGGMIRSEREREGRSHWCPSVGGYDIFAHTSTTTAHVDSATYDQAALF